MPWEAIGLSGGDGKAFETEWGTLTLRMGCSYVRFISGEPPKGCKLGIHWFRYCDSGQYEVGLFWNPNEIKQAPRRYIWKCQRALEIFDETVPWRKLRKEAVEPTHVPTVKEMQKERREFDAAHREFIGTYKYPLSRSRAKKER